MGKKGGGHKIKPNDWRCNKKKCHHRTNGDERWNFGTNDSCFLCHEPSKSPLLYNKSPAAKLEAAAGGNGAGTGGGGGGGAAAGNGKPNAWTADGAALCAANEKIKKLEEATAKQEQQARQAKRQRVDDPANGDDEEADMEVDGGKRTPKQLSEDLAGIEDDIKHFEAALKKGPLSAHRAESYAASKQQAAELRTSIREAKDPVQQLTGNQKRSNRLEREHDAFMVELKSVRQAIEEAEDHEAVVLEKIAAGQAEIAKLKLEREAVTRSLQAGTGLVQPPQEIESAWSVVRKTLVEVFDAPSLSPELQNHRAPMEEAFLAIAAVLKATQQRPPPPPLDAATAEQQQQQAVQQQQQLQQVAANTALPAEGAAVGAAEGEPAAGSGAAAVGTGAAVAPPAANTGRRGGKKAAEMSDAEHLAQPGRKEQRVGPY